MSTSPVQIKTFEKSEASPQEQSVPWSQQVDEAFFESFVVEQNTVQRIFQTQDRNMETSWNPASKIIRNLKTEDFKDSNLITSNHNNFLQKKSSQIRINKGIQIRNYTKISTRNDFRSLTCKPIIKERYPVALERNYSNETMDSKKTTWASIASQPIKSISKGSTIMSNQKKKGPGMPPPPMVPGKHNMDSVSWEFPKNNTIPVESNYTEKELIEKTVEHFSSFMVDKRSINKFDCKLQKVESKLQNKCDDRNINITDEQSFVIEHNLYPENFDGRNEIKDLVGTRPRADILVSCSNKKEDEAVIEPKNVNYSFTMNELKGKNNYNPSDLPLSIATLARFFVIKSYSEDDIHRSIKYEIWCSTDHGNKRLDDAFRERHNKGGSVLLFFSVNGSGHFCGMAQMMTSVDYNSTASVWSQDKWKGKFKVKWIYVKDVPNGQLRHIKLENNDNKSVTNSRDTQEVLNPKGIQVLKIIHSYKHQTSIFDDFYHYEKKQEEEVSKKPFDHTILRHSSQNKNFGDYYKNRNIQERHDFYGDCYTKKASPIEYDKRISPELATNREIRGIRRAQRINDSQQEDQVNLKYNRDVDFRELEEYRVGKCSLESNKVR